MLHHMRSPCSWSKSSAKAAVAPPRVKRILFIPGRRPPSLRPYRYVRVLMAIRRQVVERATRRVDLVVVLIFALVGAELLTFLEEFVVPRSPQELDVAGLGRRAERLRPFEFASLDLVGVDRITEQGTALHRVDP